MDTPKKNKGGRPRKFLETTYTQSFRVGKTLKEFYNEIEHANQFMIDTITNTPEYKAFIAKRAEQEKSNQPSLFKAE